jgi:hypothetical protein
LPTLSRAGPAQEVAGEIRGDRELDPAQHAQDRHIDRIVGQAHEQGPGHRAARAHEQWFVGQSHPATAVADLLDLDAHFDRPGQFLFRHLMQFRERDLGHGLPLSDLPRSYYLLNWTARKGHIRG